MSTTEHAEHTARRIGQIAIAPMQRGESTAAEQGEHKTGGPQQGVDARAGIGQRLLLVHQPAGDDGRKARDVGHRKVELRDG